MKRLLCPTDFSSTANNAIVYAAKFAQATGSALTLFHVQSLFDLTPKEVLAGVSDDVDQAKSMLEAQALEVAREFSISCYAELQVSGISLSTLISRAGSEFDLIIMGTNGADDLYQFFAGSNTYNVIRNATVPVLLVPDTAGYSKIELTVVAYDYLREGMPPIEQANEILHPFKCDLRVLQLLEESTSELQDEELRERQEIVTKRLIKEIPVTFDAVHTGSMIQALASYIKRNQADMLVLTSRHYGILRRILHKSLTKAMASIAEFPVLIVQA